MFHFIWAKIYLDFTYWTYQRHSKKLFRSGLKMFMCAYICMYVWVHVCMYVYASMCVGVCVMYVCVYMCTCVCVYICVYMCMCMCVCTCACICILCVYVCIYVCICVCVCVCFNKLKSEGSSDFILPYSHDLSSIWNNLDPSVLQPSLTSTKKSII